MNLTASQVDFARQIARGRGAKDGHVKDHKVSEKMSNLDVHLVGAVGEVAVGARYDAEVDARPRLHGDSHASDLLIGDYRTEVKMATYRPPYIKVVSLAHLSQSDIIVVGYVKGSEVEMWGWVSVDRFKRQYIKKSFGHKEMFSMEPNDLESITILDDYYNAYLEKNIIAVGGVPEKSRRRFLRRDSGVFVPLAS